ncbi:hypothetical protein BaRGS_00001438, partial [Batillaria attramentaria]
CRVQSLMRRMVGGTTADGCNYPSLVSITSYGFTVCNGVYSNGAIIVPDSCAGYMEYFNAYSGGDMTITAGDGTSTVIAKDDISAGISSVTANGDGTSTVTLSTDFTGGCVTNVEVYDPATHSVADVAASCRVVSYGGTSDVPEPLPGQPSETPLVSNPTLDCCDQLLPQLSTQVIGGDLSAAAGTYTCTATDAAMCAGDLGAPVYCTDDNTGADVLVGMVVNSGCLAGETFVSLDLTGGSLTGFS